MKQKLDFDVIRKMRQSTIGTADACAYRLNWTLNPDLPYKSSIMRAAGTAYHAGNAQGYEDRQAGRPFSLGLILEMARESLRSEIEQADDFFVWEYQAKTQRLDQVIWTEDDAWRNVEIALSEYWSHGGYAWPDNYEVVGVEKYFELPVPGRDDWVYSGTMDLLLFDPDKGWYTIVDHKMTKKKWYASKATAAASSQAAFYTYAVRALTETNDVSFAYDVYGLDKTFNRLPAYRSPEQVGVTMAKAMALMDIIDNGGPFLPNPASFLCHKSYCDWWSVCEFGETLKGE